MLTTVQRVRVYSLVIIGSVIVVAIFFAITARQRLADIRTMNEVRSFAYAAENFKQHHWRYPEGNRIDLRSKVTLSENGFGPGSRMYFQGSVPSHRMVSYQGTADGYLISFTLRKTWPEQGIAATKCTVREQYNLQCGR